jgi:2'-5' RNA ligase
MQRESALILPVPEAEPLVAEWRERYDPAAARGVPAHITLLYPFVPPPLHNEILGELAALFGSIDAFTIRFDHFGRFAQTLYLEPDDDERIKSIITEIRRRWPDNKPYGGLYDGVIPHLTIADRQQQQELLTKIERAIAPDLPLKAGLAEAWLIVCDKEGRWQRQAAFPMKPQMPE